MARNELNRRDFHKLAAAALGGVAAGSLVGCGGDDKDGTGAEAGGAKGAGGGKKGKNVLLEEPHVCRGLNTCKEKGAGGDNACAGQGTCSSVKEHTCKGENECKGQGGCKSSPGQNECKGKGECAVPLNDKAWKAAREAFEAAAKKADPPIKVGDAPPKPE